MRSLSNERGPCVPFFVIKMLIEMNARERIEELLIEKFTGTEFFLVNVKQAATKYQVFIDSDERLSIDKCAEVSRFLEKHLEEENLVPEKYTLEVSSPGMSNPLKHVRQYKKRIGREFDIWMNDNTHHRGELASVNGNEILIKKTIKKKKKIVGEEQVSLPLEEIKKAVLIFSFK